jgi:release factor glutamine methyltransferase
MPDAGVAGKEPPTVGAAVRQLAEQFRKAALPSPALDARLLAAHACGLSQEETIANAGLSLSPGMAAGLNEAAARRLSGEPVSRIVGRREFWGLPFKLSPHTLDPRPETELLVEAVLNHVRERGLGRERLRILDLGVGSGCVLGALLRELPLAQGVGVDLSEGAAFAARENLRALGLLPRASFLCGKWLDALGDASFDIIVSNPPYIASADIAGLGIEVRAYDPRLALDGGGDGLEAYRSILAQAFRVLREDGFLVFETGASQARSVRGMAAGAAPSNGGFTAWILSDLNGVERAVAGVRQSGPREAEAKKKIGNPALSG